MGRASAAVWVSAGSWDLCTLLQGHAGDPGPTCPRRVSWIPCTLFTPPLAEILPGSGEHWGICLWPTLLVLMQCATVTPIDTVSNPGVQIILNPLTGRPRLRGRKEPALDHSTPPSSLGVGFLACNRHVEECTDQRAQLDGLSQWEHPGSLAPRSRHT